MALLGQSVSSTEVDATRLPRLDSHFIDISFRRNPRLIFANDQFIVNTA